MRLGLRRQLRLLQLARRIGRHINSGEYSAFSGVFPLHFPALDIELDATPEQLSAMLGATEDAWTGMGEAHPHYSVITEDSYRPENLPQSIDRFWESGNIEADTAAHMLRQIGVGDLATKTCVEYGCGVGRASVPFAQKFAELHAYDISASHLALARQRAEAAGVSNIRFHHRGRGAQTPLTDCDFFYSRIVFQHNPPPVIRELIRTGLASLRPGGIAMFGVPVYISGYKFDINTYLARRRTGDMELHCIPQRAVFALIAEANCQLIEVREERTIDWVTESLSNIFVIGRPAAS